MPKLVRSRNYHSLPVQSPSSALPSGYVKQAQHVNCTVVNGDSISYLSSYSPMTPPWDTSEQQQQHQQQQRKVSEEDMYQNHSTSTDKSVVYENRGSSSNSSEYEGDRHLTHSLSLVSSASSSNTSTNTLKRRKPSVCLTDLVQHEKDSVCASISPISTSMDHRDQRISNERHERFSFRRCEADGDPPAEWWGHFTSTTNDDSFANDLDDQDDDMSNTFPLHEDCWDYNTMAHATSFIPIKQRLHHNNNYTTHSSTYKNQSHGTAMNISPSSLNGGTSWRLALGSTNLNIMSKNTNFDHHSHPYKSGNSFPMMTRRKSFSWSSVSQQPSIDRCNNNSSDSDEQQLSIGRQQQSSSSSSLFDEFILTCPNNFRVKNNTESSMDVATQRMSVLGL